MNKYFLLGRPRSGNNWVRYICNTLLGESTSDGQNATVFKSHYLERKNHIFNRNLILVVRNYKECLLRHFLAGKEDISLFKYDRDGLTNTVHARVYKYMDYLEIYEKWEKDKILIYYEDLVTIPQVVVLKLANFLNVNPNKAVTFMKNYDQHFKKSIARYSVLNESMSGGKTELYHSNKLPFEQKVEMDKLLRQQNPELYDKYLERYNETYLASR